jgi:uncharacterized protein YfaS (alpha-2-macroglobulin family)
VVRVQPGLKAKTAASSTRNRAFSIRTAAVAPAFYFASRGMVLPAAQNGGLPVTTVNVPEVDIQFLKVDPDQLAKFLERSSPDPFAEHLLRLGRARRRRRGRAMPTTISRHYPGSRLKGAVSSWELDQLHKLTSSVFVGRFLTEQKANRRSVTFIPVESIPALREPGVYVAVMSQPNRFRGDYQTTYFYVSDLGLHLRQYPSRGADAYVSSLTDGKAAWRRGELGRWPGQDAGPRRERP